MVSYGSGDDPELILERSRMPDEWRGREEPAPCGSLEAKWEPSSSAPWHLEEIPMEDTDRYSTALCYS